MMRMVSFIDKKDLDCKTFPDTFFWKKSNHGWTRINTDKRESLKLSFKI
jgi:hypothetical protein